ncbi:hypothetical protein B0H13DRAFT_2563352 [Mycena leptocephala]|nr:hypothetical protein B0H13DRAFT_2563352 [Mycena leptocephala]
MLARVFEVCVRDGPRGAFAVSSFFLSFSLSLLSILRLSFYCQFFSIRVPSAHPSPLSDTWPHRYMTSFTNEGAFGELWYTLKAIKLVTGRAEAHAEGERDGGAHQGMCSWVTPPVRCSAPFGDVDDRIRYTAAQLGLETVLWKYDSNDWKVGTNGVTTATVQANYNALIANVSAGTFDTVGAIMLTHELNNYTMQAAIDNYPALAKAFDHIVPIAVAQNRTQPYVENNYTMQSFAQYISNHSATTSLGSTSGSGSGKASQATGSGAGVRLRVPLSASVLGLVLALLGELSA